MQCPRCQADNSDASRFCAGCGMALKPTGALERLPTKTITTPVVPFATGGLLAGKYRVLEEIGRGGMGVVIRAQDTRLKRTVALKFLSLELTGNPEARERFIQEARAASALEHPNICNIHEIDEAPDGRLFMAMACYEGESLRDKIKRGKLSCGEALGVAQQVARGLAKAHEKGIVHRDIKPGNIFLTDDGQAKILDFGLAKLAADLRLTRTGATLGTVAYMSPEQAQGKPVDHRTDIWSLGVVLYEMLTGQLPFSGENEASLLFSIVHKAPDQIRKLAPETAPELERVIGKALEKNPSDRYQSMGELLEDLGALAEGLKPLRAKAKPFKSIGYIIKRRWLWGAVVVATVVVVATALYVLVAGRKAPSIDSIAVLPLKNLSGDPDQEYFADGVTEELIANLAKIKTLKVISTTSVMQYKGVRKSLPDIASELRVDAVVEGSVQQVGNRVRVTAQLIHASTDQHIWADTFEKDIRDILTLQSDLALAIAREVQVQAAEQQLLKSGARSVDPEAYKAYLKGLHVFEIGGIPGESIRHLERAIELDPGYAPAYALSASLCFWQAEFSPGDVPELCSKAKTYALKAIELDPDLGQAHAALGCYLTVCEWNWAQAEQEFQLGIKLSPNSVQAHDDYRTYLWYIGRFDEALGEISRILDLDPLSQLYRRYPAGHYYWARRYDESIFELEKLPELREIGGDPLIRQWPISFLAINYLAVGRYKEALETCEKLRSLIPMGKFDWIDTQIAYVLGKTGQRTEALEIIDHWKNRQGLDPTNMATMLIGIDEKDQAFDWLELGYKKRSPLMLYLKINPLLDPLRDDPHFQDLLNRMNFPK